MADYYIYLGKATWIEVLGFLVLFIFVLVRMIGRAWAVHKEGLGRWRKLGVLLKGIGWLGILSVYLFMLYAVEPDWFASPQWIVGEIQEKIMTESSVQPYIIKVKSEHESKNLSVDGFSYRELIPGQKVKMSYLPHRLEVVTCEILSD